MSKLVKEVKAWIKKSCFNAEHMVRTAYWVEKVDPKAGEAVIIAALAHDVERAFERGRKPPKDEETIDWSDVEYSLWHGERSARIVYGFLKERDASDELMGEVCRMIAAHELGGDPKIDLVKDADSISFLEVVAPQFISWVPKRYSAQAIREKLDWMYNRISGSKARRLAEPFYQKALRKLSQKSS